MIRTFLLSFCIVTSLCGADTLLSDSLGILLKEKILQPFLEHKELYALWLVNKCCSNHLLQYYESHYEALMNKHCVVGNSTTLGPFFMHSPYISMKDGEKKILIDIGTVLFDLTGRYAYGFAFEHNASLCCFKYPEEVLLGKKQFQSFGQHRGKEFVKTKNRTLVCVLGTTDDNEKNVVAYTALGHYVYFSDHSVNSWKSPGWATACTLKTERNTAQYLRPIWYVTSEHNPRGFYTDIPILTITQKSAITIVGNTLQWWRVCMPDHAPSQ